MFARYKVDSESICFINLEPTKDIKESRKYYQKQSAQDPKCRPGSGVKQVKGFITKKGVDISSVQKQAELFRKFHANKQ